KRYKDQHLISFALSEALKVYEAVKRHKKTIRVSLAGNLRRQKEVIKDIDVVASSEDDKGLMDTFTGLAEVESVIAKGETKSSVRLQAGINADLRIVSDQEFPYA